MALLPWLLFLAAVCLRSAAARAAAEAAAGPVPLEPIKFPPMGLHGPAAPRPHYDQEPALSTRLQPTRRPVGRAAAALRGVASRLRLLVAPSGGGAANETSGNLLMSPLSVAAALGQMLLGAQGETRSLLADLLAAPNAGGDGGGGLGEVPDLDYHQQFKALLETLGSEERMRGPDAGVELRLASAFFSQRGLPLRVDFQHALHDLYHADVRQLDFRERPAVAQATVNAWARQATRGRIPTVLANPLPPSSAALVASAVYFRGAWEWPFDSDLSVNGWFRMGPRRRVAVKFMRSHFSDMRYAENVAQGYRMAVLPYKDGETVMYVILPNQKDADLTTFSTQMSLERMLATARSADPHTVTIVLPRMSISGSFSLKEPLSKLKTMKRLPRSVPKHPDMEVASRNEDQLRSREFKNPFERSGSSSPSRLLNRPLKSKRAGPSSSETETHLPKSDFGSQAVGSEAQYWEIRPESGDSYSKSETQVSDHQSGVSRTAQNFESDSRPFTVLSGGSFVSDNVRKRRSASEVTRNVPEPRSQETHFPGMQLAVGMSSPQVTLRRQIPRSSMQVSENSDKSKVPVSNMGLGVGVMLPSVRATPISNKPMVLGVPLTIVESDDSNVLPKHPLEYQNDGKEHTSGKTLQHSFRDMEIPYPYRPVPGQDLKPPFDKPPKLLTIKDILPRIVVGTTVTFPFDQSNESVPLGSKLTTRPSGLIHKKQRDRVGNTQVRSVSVTEDEAVLSVGSVLPATLVENISTEKDHILSSQSPKNVTLETEDNVDSIKVPLNISISEKPHSTNTTPENFESSSNVSSTLPPDVLLPTPVMSFLANVEYSEPFPIISSSVHVENSSSLVEDILPASNSSSFHSQIDLLSHTPSPLPQIVENRFSSDNSNSSSSSPSVPSPNSSNSSTPKTPSNITHTKFPDFPEIEETGDLLNPLAVGAQGLWTIRPQPANYDVYNDIVLDLTGASTDRRLRVSDALHHVWLEVTETGTEAAAVTATIADYSGDNQVMKVDRPFVLAIVHEPTEALLFLAAVSDPTGGSGIRTDIPPKKAPPTG